MAKLLNKTGCETIDYFGVGASEVFVSDFGFVAQRLNDFIVHVGVARYQLPERLAT